MENLVLFLNSFLSYLLVFLICVAVVCTAIFIGVRARRIKDSKAEMAKEVHEAVKEEPDTESAL